MASLRDEARYILDYARNGVLWFAVWKTGRSWHVREIMTAEYTQAWHNYPEKWECDEDDMKTMTDIYNQDNNAVMLNGYYRNIGSLEEMTLDSLVDGIRFQYGLGSNMPDILEKMKVTAA